MADYFINYKYSIGDYAGFDENEPTSKSGGKGVVVDLLKRTHGYKNLVLIGDGATDLEASPPADTFIGEYFGLIFLYLYSIFYKGMEEM